MTDKIAPQSRLGFTLVELLAVVAIIGILSAAATVGFFALVERENVRSAGGTIHGAFARVVADSRKFNDTLSLSINATGITAYKSANCSAGTDYFKVTLDERVAILELESGAVAPVGAANFRPGSAWGFSCLTLAPQLGMSPLTLPGYLIIGQNNGNRYRIMVYKGQQENRVLTLLSNDGGSTWSPN